MHFLLITDVKCLRVRWTSKIDCYHLADVQSRGVGLPADGPQEAVHFLDGSDLLLVILLLWVSGDDGHLQAFVRFTHRLHLRVLPEVDASVLQLFGAVCAEEVVKIPQNLQRERSWQGHRSVFLFVQGFTLQISDSYSRLSDNEGCFGTQRAQDPCHFYCDVTCTDNHTAPVRRTKPLIVHWNFKNHTKTQAGLYHNKLTLAEILVQKSHHW